MSGPNLRPSPAVGRIPSACSGPTKWVLFAIVLLSSWDLAVAAEIPFAALPSDVDTSFSDAVELGAADFDRDGAAELAGAGADGVRVWAPMGAGWTSQSLLTGTAARALALADFDGDGLVDLAAPTAGEVAWWQNGDGVDGVFSASMQVDSSTQVLDLVAADLDGDGDVDLVGATGGVSGSILWWQNSPVSPFAGTTSAISWSVSTVGALAHASSVAIADLDGDGDLDIAATADSSGDRVVYFDNTAGDASAWTLRTVDASFEDSTHIAVGDLDGDGDMDLLAAGLDTGSPVVGIWLSDGTPSNGGFTASTEDADGLGHISLADLDADGDLDFSQAAGNRLDWWESEGDGSTFQRRLVASPTSAAAVLSGDLDGDGDLDLAAASQTDDDVLLWANDSLHRSASFRQEVPLDTSFTGARAVHGADLDGDGDMDIAGAAFDKGEVAWWQNTDAGFVRHSIDLAATHAFGLRAADVDGDGDLDLIGALGRENFENGTNRLVWWENGGPARSLTWTRHEIATNINLVGGAADPWPVDMDLDGDLDVLLASAGADRLAWWENTQGDGTAWSESLVADPFGRTHSAVAADIDGDGDPDVVAVADTADEVAWWQNLSGDGSSWSKVSIETGWDGAYDVWAADIDGDGDIDVLAASQFEDRISFWRNDGVGGFGTEETLGNPGLAAEGFFNQAYSVQAADLDGDGDLDVAGAAFKDGGKLAWWENLSGDATSWQRHDVDGAYDGASSIFVADVSRDGRLDFLTTAQTDGEITFWPNGGGQFVLDSVPSAATEVSNSQTETLFELELTPRGKASEGDVELASIALLFEEAPGDVLASAEASSLVASLEILADDGSTPGSVDGTDTSLASLGSLTLTDGVLVVDLPDDDPAAATMQGDTRIFFVQVTTTADFESQPLLGLRVSHLSETGPGQITSTAEEEATDIDLRPEWIPQTSTATFPVADQADLSVDVEANVSTSPPGSQISFTLTVANAGPEIATDVSLALDLTGDTTSITTTGCAEDPSGLPACSLGSIAASQQKIVTVVVDIAAMASGDIGLDATVSGALPDPQPTNDSSSDSVTVASSADLSVDLSASADPVMAGENLSWTVTVDNDGPNSAENVTLTFALGGQASLVSTSGCTEDPSGLPTCSLGNLAASSQTQVTVTVAVAAEASGSITLEATVGSSTSDPDSGNDMLTSEIDVTAVADLELALDAPANYSSSASIKYSIVVSNIGPGPAEATVTDDFPPAIEGVEWTCDASPGSTCPATGSGDINAPILLPSGGQVTFTATGKVRAAFSAPITNSAAVMTDASVHDPDGDNDQESGTSTWLGLFADGFESGTITAW